MPCYDSRPDEPKSRADRRASTLAQYITEMAHEFGLVPSVTASAIQNHDQAFDPGQYLDELTAELCGIFCGITPEQRAYVAQIHQPLREWWAEHERFDVERERWDEAEIERLKLVEAIKAKLTSAEWEAIRHGETARRFRYGG